MKVLHVLYSGLGGHGNVFFSMVSADTTGEFVFEALFNGVEPVRNEYLQTCKKKNITYNYVSKKPGLDINYLIQLYKTIKRSKAAVVFLHGGNAVAAAWFAKLFSKHIKKILVRETQANHLKTKGDWVRLSLSMLLADQVIFLSEEYKEQIASKLSLLYNSRRISVIPNGIDMDIFKPGLQVNTNTIVLGMQSRLVKIKDHETLLHAFAQIKKQRSNMLIKLLLAGDGEQMEYLVNLSKQLGIEKEVQFKGMIDQSELVGFLNELDIYIHASFGETMSTAIMQAMACKKAIIASDVPGISNMIIQQQTGLLVPVKNIAAMVAAINLLIDNRELREAIASNALGFAAENYSNTRMFNNYKKIFIQ